MEAAHKSAQSVNYQSRRWGSLTHYSGPGSNAHYVDTHPPSDYSAVPDYSDDFIHINGIHPIWGCDGDKWTECPDEDWHRGSSVHIFE